MRSRARLQCKLEQALQRLAVHHGSACPTMVYTKREWAYWNEWFERPWRAAPGKQGKKQPYWSCSCGAADNWATRAFCRDCGGAGPRQAGGGQGVEQHEAANGARGQTQATTGKQQDTVQQLTAAIATLGMLGEDLGGPVRKELERKLEEAKAAKRALQAPHAAWKEAQNALDRAEKRVARAEEARRETADKLAKLDAELAKGIIDREAAKAALEVARATVVFPPPSSGSTDAFESRIQACRAVLTGFEGSSVYAAAQAGLEHIMALYKAEQEQNATAASPLEGGSTRDGPISDDAGTGADDEGMEDPEDRDAEEHRCKVRRFLDKAAELQAQPAEGERANGEEHGSPGVAGMYGDALALLREFQGRKARAPRGTRATPFSS